MEKWASKEDFFACEVPREKATIPGPTAMRQSWVYGLTCAEKDEYENMVMRFNARDRQFRMNNARAILMQLTIRDQHGNRLFAEEDIGRLAQVPAIIADPILDVARRLSAMGAGEIEELVKNSEMLQEQSGGASDTVSPMQKDGQKPKSQIVSVPAS